MVAALLRMEIACLAIVVFVAANYFSSRRKKTYIHRLFSELIVVSAVNLVFDGVTVCTVNHLDEVPPAVNFVCHKLFLGSLLSVVFIVFLYILTLVQPSGAERNRRHPLEYASFFVLLALVLVLPIDYVRTDRGNYSFGPYAYAAYAGMLLYLVGAIVFFIRSWRAINRKKLHAIVLALAFIATGLTVQAVVPTSLISGIGVTALVLAFFFTVESPDANLVEMLKSEKEKADAASRAKTTFLANMSHEIRTPINAVLGFDEIIIRESKEPKIVEYARDIENAGKSLLGLVNDVLDFSKIEAGKMTLLERNYELSALVSDVVNMVSFRARTKNLTLRVNVNKDIPNVLFGDDLRIKQIMLNILNNAVKYTEKGSVVLNVGYEKVEQMDGSGYVSVDTFSQRESFILLAVSVSDTGIGIKEDELRKLFSPFERIDENRNRTVEGSGLGMSIVKRLLSMMGSSLSVESEYGKGSTFSFSIRQPVVDWKPVGTFVDSGEHGKPSAYRAKFTAPTARILIVDDVRMNIVVISALLKPLCMRIDTAMSGDEACAMAEKNLYDVVFLDHRMPGKDGVETLREMRSRSGGLNDGTPVIALTANAVSGAREFYIQNGFSDYLSKPVDMRHLEQALLEHLPKSKLVFSDGGGQEVAVPAPSSEAVAPGATDGLYVDEEAGVANCGSRELYKDVVAEFCASSGGYAKKLSDYLSASDWKNAAVMAHSIKSSARTIGAHLLSDKAASVESALLSSGSETALGEVQELLSLLRRYAESLSA